MIPCTVVFCRKIYRKKANCITEFKNKHGPDRELNPGPPRFGEYTLTRNHTTRPSGRLNHARKGSNRTHNVILGLLETGEETLDVDWHTTFPGIYLHGSRAHPFFVVVAICFEYC